MLQSGSPLLLFCESLVVLLGVPKTSILYSIKGWGVDVVPT